MPIEVRGPTALDTSRNIGAQVKSFMIRTFESALREEVAKGFDSQPVVFTDGWPRRDYNSVRNFGRIEARPRAQLGNVVEWLIDELERLSPIGPGRDGHYRDSHVVIVDGQIVADLSKIPAGRRIVVANVKPYAGKIEGVDAYTRWEIRGGKKSRRAKRKAQGWKASAMRGQSSQAPNGVYRVAIRNLAKRFGRTVVAMYQPQPLPPTVAAKVMVATKRGKSRAQVYPAIVLGVLN